MDKVCLALWGGLGLSAAMAPNPPGTIRLVADNLLDTRVTNGLAGYAANGTPLYWTVPGRSFFVTASLKF